MAVAIKEPKAASCVTKARIGLEWLLNKNRYPLSHSLYVNRKEEKHTQVTELLTELISWLK